MRLQRLLGILATLLNQKRVSADYLAQRFEVSTRTIYRDLVTLEQAGVPIITYTGANGGIEIMDTYKLDKNVFLNEDFTTILSGLKSISGTLDPAIVNRTLAKLEALIPSQHTKEVKLSSNKLYIDLKPWSMHPGFQSLYQTVHTAVEEDRLIEFTYTAREHSASSRIVEPHQLLLKEQIWYLRGYCRKRKDFRTFRLQRMSHIILHDETFVPRSFPKEATDFKEWTHPNMITVELTAAQNSFHDLLENCRPEYISEQPDGTYFVRLPFVESDIGYTTLIQMGGFCKFLSPPHVIAELRQRLQQMLENL